MKTINLNVSEEYVSGAGIIAGAAGSADSTTIHVVFSEDWDGLSKYATTRNSRGESATVTALTTDKLVTGTTNEYEFTIPQTAMAYEGQMSVTFTGYAVVNGNEVSNVTNTATAYLRVLQSDWTSAGDDSITPTLFEQLQAEIDDIIEDISDARIAATEASESATSASASASSASTSETNAATSETNAAASASSASTSATNAAQSEANAAVSETNAATSETNAATSETNAAASAASASVSETNAASSETSAASSASSASDSATSASASATTATTKASEASTSATVSRSYAVGDTETRQGEATDNAHYYYEQCKTMVESLNEGLVPSGTLTFENLPSLSVAVTGAMYNVSNEFTTTSDFEEGAGRVIPAGTNIYKTNNNKWDVLAGSPVTGVKGDSELDYRRGNVNITKANIGLGNVDNTSDSAKSTAFGTFTSYDDIDADTWVEPNEFESDTVPNLFSELSKTVKNTRALHENLVDTQVELSYVEDSFGDTEMSNTAVHAHAQGSYFAWMGTYVKATSAIAIGDTISNSNTSPTTILASVDDIYSASTGASKIGYGNTNVASAIDGVKSRLTTVEGKFNASSIGVTTPQYAPSMSDAQEYLDYLYNQKMRNFGVSFNYDDSSHSYDSLSVRKAVLVEIYNHYKTRDLATNGVMCWAEVKYYGGVDVMYMLWKSSLGINVIEYCPWDGVIRTYNGNRTSSSATFEQTLEYKNYFSSKTFNATVKTFTGMTVSTTALTMYPTYSVFSGGYTVGSNAITLQSDFQVGSYYYFILATFGSDAESTFADVENDTLLSSPPVLYVYENQLRQTNLRIFKHANKIYLAYRGTASSQTFQAGFKAQSIYALISNAKVLVDAYFKE